MKIFKFGQMIISKKSLLDYSAFSTSSGDDDLKRLAGAGSEAPKVTTQDNNTSGLESDALNKEVKQDAGVDKVTTTPVEQVASKAIDDKSTTDKSDANELDLDKILTIVENDKEIDTSKKESGITIESNNKDDLTKQPKSGTTQDEGSGDIQGRDGVEESDLVASVEEMNLYQHSKDMADEAEAVYHETYTNNSRKTVPDNEMGHIKDPSYAKEVASAKDLFNRWHIRIDLLKLFLRAVYNAVKDIEPIGINYIAELSRHMLSQEKNLVSILANILPMKITTAGYAIYGLAVGAHDLIHYIPSKIEEITFRYSYNMSKQDENKIEVVIDEAHDTSIKIKKFEIFSFDPIMTSDLGRVEYIKTMFLGMYKESILDSLYKFHVTKADKKFTSVSDSHRKSIVPRGSSRNETIEGYQVNTVFHGDGSELPLFRAYILERLAPLFHLLDMNLNLDEQHDVIKVITTIIHMYIKKLHTIKDMDIVVKSIDLDITISRKIPNNKLREQYCAAVDNGKIVPVSPLQMVKYLNNIDMSKWLPAAFFSALIDHNMDKRMRDVLPDMTQVSKFNLSQYARERIRLNSNYYESDRAAEYAKKLVFGIGFKNVIQELLVRTIIKGELPDYFMLITRGDWTNSGRQSNVVEVPKNHSLLCKFSIANEQDNINDYCNRLCLIYKKHRTYRAPSFVKSTTRLSKEIPQIYHRLLPMNNETTMITYSDNDAYEL